MILTAADAANALSDAYLTKLDELQDAYANRGPIAPGAFKTNGVVYQVKESKGSSRLYAKVLTNGVFEYVAGAIYKVREADRLTMEQAIAESALIGACVICGRTLTDPKSVAKGIGPICAKRVA